MGNIFESWLMSSSRLLPLLQSLINRFREMESLTTYARHLATHALTESKHNQLLLFTVCLISSSSIPNWNSTRWCFELLNWVSSGKPGPLNRLKGNFISITLTEYLDLVSLLLFICFRVEYVQLLLPTPATSSPPNHSTSSAVCPMTLLGFRYDLFSFTWAKMLSLIASPCKSGRTQDLPNQQCFRLDYNI